MNPPAQSRKKLTSTRDIYSKHRNNSEQGRQQSKKHGHVVPKDGGLYRFGVRILTLVVLSSTEIALHARPVWRSCLKRIGRLTYLYSRRLNTQWVYSSSSLVHGLLDLINNGQIDHRSVECPVPTYLPWIESDSHRLS